MALVTADGDFGGCCCPKLCASVDTRTTPKLIVPLASFAKLAPDLRPRRADHDLTAYVRHWRSVTVPEIASNFSWTVDQARQELIRADLGAAVRDARRLPLTDPAAI